MVIWLQGYLVREHPDHLLWRRSSHLVDVLFGHVSIDVDVEKLPRESDLVRVSSASASDSPSSKTVFRLGRKRDHLLIGLLYRATTHPYEHHYWIWDVGRATGWCFGCRQRVRIVWRATWGAGSVI